MIYIIVCTLKVHSEQWSLHTNVHLNCPSQWMNLMCQSMATTTLFWISFYIFSNSFVRIWLIWIWYIHMWYDSRIMYESLIMMMSPYNHRSEWGILTFRRNQTFNIFFVDFSHSQTALIIIFLDAVLLAWFPFDNQYCLLFIKLGWFN